MIYWYGKKVDARLSKKTLLEIIEHLVAYGKKRKTPEQRLDQFIKEVQHNVVN